MRQATIGFSALLALVLASSASAQDIKVSGNSVSVRFPGQGYVTWQIAGPGGFHRTVIAEERVATIDLGGKVADGLYKYEGTGASHERTQYKNPHGLDNGRGKEPEEISVGLYVSGSFRVENGKIVMSDEDDMRDATDN